MATLYYRDPNTKAMVPILGGMTQAQTDPLYVKKPGDTMTGPLVVSNSNSSNELTVRNVTAGMDPNIFIDGLAGRTRRLGFSSSGATRWTVSASSAAEGGSNAGSDFQVYRFDDSGNVIDGPFVINRATGKITALQNINTSTLEVGNVWGGTTYQGIQTGGSTTSTGSAVLLGPASGSSYLMGPTGGASVRIRPAADGGSATDLVVAPTLVTCQQALTVTGNLTSNGGIGMGSTAASSVTDLSRHLAIYSTTYGMCVTSGKLNVVAPSGAVISLQGTNAETTGKGIAYPGTTYPGGGANVVGFRWTSPSVYASVDNVNSIPLASSSGRRYKTAIIDLKGALAKVKKMHVVEYSAVDIDGTPSPNKDRLPGLVADEVDRLYPALAVKSSTGVLESVDYTMLVPVLIKAMQEQQTQIEALEARVKVLEAA